jgi:cobalt/nickel transport system permease protein
MPAITAVVLLFQAMLLAHGGLTTFGANLVALGVAGPWVAVGMHRSLHGLMPRPLTLGVAAACGSLATYATTAFQLALAFPDPVQGIGGAFVRFALLFGVTQVPLAVVEGVLCAVTLAALAPPRTARTPAPTA